jgi:uncharacterized protein DUF3551
MFGYVRGAVRGRYFVSIWDKIDRHDDTSRKWVMRAGAFSGAVGVFGLGAAENARTDSAESWPGMCRRLIAINQCGVVIDHSKELGILRRYPLERTRIMRAIGLVSITLATIVLAATNAAAAQWCAIYTDQMGGSENCGYATLDQCRAQVLGLGGWCRPNPFPGTAFGTSGTWSNPPRQGRGGY